MAIRDQSRAPWPNLRRVARPSCRRRSGTCGVRPLPWARCTMRFQQQYSHRLAFPCSSELRSEQSRGAAPDLTDDTGIPAVNSFSRERNLKSRWLRHRAFEGAALGPASRLCRRSRSGGGRFISGTGAMGNDPSSRSRQNVRRTMWKPVHHRRSVFVTAGAVLVPIRSGLALRAPLRQEQSSQPDHNIVAENEIRRERAWRNHERGPQGETGSTISRRGFLQGA